MPYWQNEDDSWSGYPDYYYKNDINSRIKYWLFEEIIPFIIWAVILMVGGGLLSKLLFGRP